MPNVLAPVIVLGGVNLGSVIMGIAGLSFLGMGIQPPTPSWGRMLSEGYTNVDLSPWGLLWPALVLAIVMIGCSLFSESLRVALNPKEKA